MVVVSPDRLSLGMQTQYRDVRRVENLPGHAAEEPSRQTFSTMGFHPDDVVPIFFGIVDDLSRRIDSQDGRHDHILDTGFGEDILLLVQLSD